jgi:hypothetical protein
MEIQKGQAQAQKLEADEWNVTHLNFSITSSREV